MQPATGAEKAGLRVGDIVLSIDGTDTTDGPTMVNLLAKYEPEARVKLKVERDGRARTVSLTLCDVAEQAGVHE